MAMQAELFECEENWKQNRIPEDRLERVAILVTNHSKKHTISLMSHAIIHKVYVASDGKDWYGEQYCWCAVF